MWLLDPVLTMARRGSRRCFRAAVVVIVVVCLFSKQLFDGCETCTKRLFRMCARVLVHTFWRFVAMFFFIVVYSPCVCSQKCDLMFVRLSSDSKWNGHADESTMLFTKRKRMRRSRENIRHCERPQRRCEQKTSRRQTMMTVIAMKYWNCWRCRKWSDRRKMNHSKLRTHAIVNEKHKNA